MINTICCIHSKLPPGNEQLIYSKHVEDDNSNKLREKSATSWSLLRKYITMYGPKNVKKLKPCLVTLLPYQELEEMNGYVLYNRNYIYFGNLNYIRKK
jgi:hypothetical protein